jgi:Flp pilus assembly protein TadD
VRRADPPAPSGVLAAEAEVAWEDGDKGSALTLLSRAVADRPESADARSRFGRRLMRVTAFELAQEHLEKAAELSPNDPQVQLDLVTLYEKTGDADRAAEARERAKSLSPGSTVIQDEQGFYTFEQ